MSNASEKPQTQKHVIILGAGASFTSGYPLADRLRLLMSSEKDFKAELTRALPEKPDLVAPIAFDLMFRPNRSAIELFRHGGFATIDEFSKLASHCYPKEIQELKKLLRFVLAIHNPEDDFTSSDYYVFIQKLFRSDLFSLRDDVAILTFNYEPYLPYLLRKAYHTRCQAAGIKAEYHVEDAITSGLACRLIGDLEAGTGLCALQLHGSIAWPQKFTDEAVLCYEDLFATSAEQRIDKLCTTTDATPPPVVFPWEVIQPDGQFLSESQFCLSEQIDKRGRRQGGYSGDYSLHQLFVSIWKRASKEVTTATKLSFVGLSMHDFLNPAFKFLFAEKRDNAALVVCNKDHERFRSADDVEAHTNPRSPTYKVRRLLAQICASIKGVPKRGTAKVWLDGGAKVRVLETFRQFILNEMD